MTNNMQFGKFTHAKCTTCGKFGSIDNFNTERKQLAASKFDDGSTAEMVQLIITCPVCSSEFCEAFTTPELN